MPTDAGDLIRGWLAAGDAGDLDAFDRLLHADVVVHAPLGLSTEGVDAEKEVWRMVLAGIPDLRHDVREVVTLGSTAGARVVVTGTHVGEFLGVQGTGKRFLVDQAVFAHVRDGKIAEAWEIADTAAVRQQLGLVSAEDDRPS